MSKRTVILSIACLLVLGLLSTANAAKQLTVGLIVQNASALSQVRTTQSFEKLAKAKGWTVLTGDAKGASDKLANLMEDFVQRKADAIVVAMAELPAAKGAIIAANRAKIPIYAIDSGYTEGIEVDITSNNYIIGSQMACYLVDKIGGKGKIVAIGMKEHHGTRKRRATLDVVLSENPNVKLLADFNVRYTNFYEDAQKAMEDFITRFGNDIDAVWCAWDDLADAAAKAIAAAGFTRKDMFVVGADGHPHAFENIRNNTAVEATVAQEFEWMAAEAVDIIDKIHVQGLPKAKVIPTNTVYVPTMLVTPVNCPAEGKLPYKLPWEK